MNLAEDLRRNFGKSFSLRGAGKLLNGELSKLFGKSRGKLKRELRFILFNFLRGILSVGLETPTASKILPLKFNLLNSIKFELIGG